MKRFKNILLVNDPEVDQASAIKRAVSLAKNNQAKLSVINVIPRIQDKNREQRMANHLQGLDSLIAPCKQHLEINTSVTEGTIFLEVIRAVLRNGHDLVIKPAENPDFLKQLFGSDDMHLLRKCPCPVWLMKLPEKEKYDCILAAVDFNPLQFKPEEQDLNINILEIAGSLAVSETAALHLIHSWEAYAETAMKFFGDVPDRQVATHTNKQHMLHQKGVSRLWDSVRERNGSFDSLSPHFHLPRGIFSTS
jgi:universal stress protein E